MDGFNCGRTSADPANPDISVDGSIYVESARLNSSQSIPNDTDVLVALIGRQAIVLGMGAYHAPRTE